MGVFSYLVAIKVAKHVTNGQRRVGVALIRKTRLASSSQRDTTNGLHPAAPAPRRGASSTPAPPPPLRPAAR
jgi:hypothetical protein